MSAPDVARLPGHWLGSFLKAVPGPVIVWMCRTRVRGVENIPAEGPAIVVSNHVSNLDPILVQTLSPRYLYYMAKQEMFETPVSRWIYLRWGAIPVRRGAPDRWAIERATQLLREGHALGLFPEGTRGSGELGEGHAGAAFLALRANAPVIPAGVAGTLGLRFPRLPRVSISFGPPIDPAVFSEGSRRERTDALTAAIMQGIATQLEEASSA